MRRWVVGQGQSGRGSLGKIAQRFPGLALEDALAAVNLCQVVFAVGFVSSVWRQRTKQTQFGDECCGPSLTLLHFSTTPQICHTTSITAFCGKPRRRRRQVVHPTILPPRNIRLWGDRLSRSRGTIWIFTIVTANGAIHVHTRCHGLQKL